jgi:hypothetical protein
MNLKFSSKLDIQTFLVESRVDSALSKIDSVDIGYVPTDEELKGFIKSRSSLIGKLKDHRKSANSKANWRQNRTKMMKGIKAFHKSVEGKKFHKKLGNFIATRIFRTKPKRNESRNREMLLDKQEHLKALNSAKQHFLIELEYFHQVQEQIELEEMITCYAYPYFKIIEDKIISDEDLSDDELVFLVDIVENKALIKSMADKSGKTFAQIEKLWDSISNQLIKDGTSKDNEKFFPFLVTILKKKIGLADEK